MAPDSAAALEGRIADLGRRIAEARADAETRSAGRPFPKLLLAAVVLVVALVTGGLALAARDTGGGDGPVAAPRAVPVQAPVAQQAEEPPAQEAAAPAPAEVATPALPEVRAITVAVGESFWSIAEREVGASLGRAPTTAEVTTWWAAFMAANADRLVEPGNPNLLVTGQVLVVPSGGA